MNFTGNMKEQLQQLLFKSLNALHSDGVITEVPTHIRLDHAKDKKHGDYATNIALSLSKQAKCAPNVLAEQIIAKIGDSTLINKTEIAGPGFINFFLSVESNSAVISDILNLADDYGTSNIGKDKRVLLEFGGANPTGPLHVGHGRGAAYGATVANLMRAVGFKVDNEYYINDAGRQVDILTLSIFLRYLSYLGEDLRFPDNGYQGKYIKEIAQDMLDNHKDSWRKNTNELFTDICKDGAEGGDKERHIDELIERTKKLLGEDYQAVLKIGIKSILGDIKADLKEFGVSYDKWFSELSMINNGLTKSTIEKLQHSGHIYEKDGALWFKTTDYGDEKDRVVIRKNGAHTYFASDIAYHLDKFNRGYDKIINIWGADHHGYIARIKASITALNHKAEKLEILLVQFASLYRGGKKVQMSTRSGSFVTLKELRQEVGNDAARFFYILRKSEQHMDFDLDLAKSKTNKNPVFYIQYAYARICSVLKQASKEGFEINPSAADLSLLREESEKSLLKELSRYKSIVESSALQYEPHQLAYYLTDLAAHFHRYYNACTFLVEDDALTQARLALISANKQVIANGLSLLGVRVRESM